MEEVNQKENILTEISIDLSKAITTLSLGICIGIPTETVYGLAGNALNEEAVVKIFQIKNRPFFDPLIVHADSIFKISEFVDDWDERLLRLARKFWPGPLTLLLPKKPIVPDLITSGLERVAVRIPNHPLTLQLLSQLDFPLAAPSANPFGYISPTTAQHVHDQLSGKIPLILDGGPCVVGLESTIVGIENDKVIVYRLGGLSVQEIEQEIGKIEIKNHSSSNPQAPGALASHYAPRKKLIFGDIDSQLPKYKSEDIGILSFQKTYTNIPLHHQKILSASGDLNEAAKNLFAAMRALDACDITVILAERFPQEGLGLAINDRLRRAGA